VSEVVAELLVTGSVTVDSHDQPAIGRGVSEPGYGYQLFVVAAVLTSLREVHATYRLAGFVGVFTRVSGHLAENLRGYAWAIRNRNTDDCSAANLPTVIEIDAADLEYQSLFTREHFPTKDSDTARSPVHDEPVVGIVGGRWDRFRILWAETRIHRSLRTRFVDGAEWAETEQYRYAATRIDTGLDDWRSSTPADLDRRCADLDALYESMADEGYVPQTELLERGDETMETVSAAMKPICGTEFPHEMRVGIGREGALIRFSAGKHRLSIAKLLDLENVPVVVVVRHERWAAIRNAFDAADSLADVPPAYRQFDGHPDLRAVTRWDPSPNDKAPSRAR
jgi:hypothetical protein